jgi:PelA/Pel-15E family pectate lyase
VFCAGNCIWMMAWILFMGLQHLVPPAPAASHPGETEDAGFVPADGHPDAGSLMPSLRHAAGLDSRMIVQALPSGATAPQPADGSLHINPVQVVLRWAPGPNATTHRLFFGPADPPAFREEMSRLFYETGPLAQGTTYFWRVDELTPSGIVIGSTWRFTTAGSAGTAGPPFVAWTQILDQPAKWYATAEAVRTAENVLLYQRRNGGWPKNIDMAVSLSRAGRARLAGEKQLTDTTIDNNATTTQIRFLARVLAATRDPRFFAGLAAGLHFLLEAQYPNGGWPQYYPLRNDYSRHITFNDDAMIRVMDLLDEVAHARPPFDVVDQKTRSRAAQAVERGVQLVLNAQVMVSGRLTVWCAQHDEATLRPCGARTYELPSLSGRESVTIVRFLMSRERPSPEIVRSIEKAIQWFQASMIKGTRLERKLDPSLPRGFDYLLVADAAAPPIWARFYDIATNAPLYVGRDGVIKKHLADIEYERRTGYTYLGPFAADLLEKDLPSWKKKITPDPAPPSGKLGR